jgi:hypothetical protein
MGKNEVEKFIVYNTLALVVGIPIFILTILITDSLNIYHELKMVIFVIIYLYSLRITKIILKNHGYLNFEEDSKVTETTNFDNYKKQGKKTIIGSIEGYLIPLYDSLLDTEVSFIFVFEKNGKRYRIDDITQNSDVEKDIGILLSEWNKKN